MVSNNISRLSQSLCDPVLRDTEAVHAEYCEFQFYLRSRPKIGDIGIYCLSGTADDLSDFRRGQTEIVLRFDAGKPNFMGLSI